MTITFDTIGYLGDKLCLLSASREDARRNPQDEIYIPHLFDVIPLYDDGLVKPGSVGKQVMVSAKHREKVFSNRLNYLGTFLREMVPDIRFPMNLDLPKFSVEDRIPVIQPRSTYAENPPTEYVQGLVNEFRRRTQQVIYAVGAASTPRDLNGVDYSLLCDSVPEFLRNVARASIVLTPRSAGAHMAAGYGIPTFAWVPDDGENWHLDYPGWNRHLHNFELGAEDAIDSLRFFVDTVGRFKFHAGRTRFRQGSRIVWSPNEGPSEKVSNPQ